MTYDLLVLGAGAAGFFGALAAKASNTKASIAILEKSSQSLSKVRISGGGRCNVTHSCFDPKQLILNYPRGSHSLLGPFTRFQPKDTINWFLKRGVELKTEKDGRMFPITNDSETIIHCLQKEAHQLGIEFLYKYDVLEIIKNENKFELKLSSGGKLTSKAILLATGSHPSGHTLARSLGHTIQPLVPSLFTFNVPRSTLLDLAGISLTFAKVSLEGRKLYQTGPLLLTHWGFSGPAALKLSAWEARYLHEQNYKVNLTVNWLGDVSTEEAIGILKNLRQSIPGQSLFIENPFELPKNLWKRFLQLLELEKKRFSDLSNEMMSKLGKKLTNDLYPVEGKTTNKEEFVTCGGVTLKEIDFKKMESKLCSGLFFSGEILDIDAVTGGFNFQNAWTTGWIAGNSCLV